MKKLELVERNRRKSRKWFQRRGRAHDRMLVLNMSIFNAGRGWQRVFNPTQCENVWA